MDKLIKPCLEYKALPAKVAQQVLKLLDKSWKGYFAAIAEYKIDKSLFTGRPKIPGYKPKDGRTVLIFSEQSTSKKVFKKSGQGNRVGIDIIVREESYTSQSSFLDGDFIPAYGSKPKTWKPSGKRICRGLYRTKSGRLCNADINGSYNILTKEFPNAFSQRETLKANVTGDREVLVDPIRVNIGGFIAKSLTPF